MRGVSLPNQVRDRDAARRTGVRAERRDTYEWDPFYDDLDEMDLERHYGEGWGCSGLVQVGPHRVMVGSGPRAWLASCAGCGERFWGRSGEVVAEARRVHVNGSAW